MPSSTGDGRCAVFPTGTTNPALPVILTIPVPSADIDILPLLPLDTVNANVLLTVEVVTFPAITLPVTLSNPVMYSPVEANTTTDTLPAGVNLVLIGVSGRSWVGLTNANGEQVFDGQIMAGQIQSFSDPQVLKAVIGNAGAVSIKVNGKDLGVVGSDGQVVRLDFDANKLL